MQTTHRPPRVTPYEKRRAADRVADIIVCLIVAGVIVAVVWRCAELFGQGAV